MGCLSELFIFANLHPSRVTTSSLEKNPLPVFWFQVINLVQFSGVKVCSCIVCRTKTGSNPTLEPYLQIDKGHQSGDANHTTTQWVVSIPHLHLAFQVQPCICLGIVSAGYRSCEFLRPPCRPKPPKEFFTLSSWCIRGSVWMHSSNKLSIWSFSSARTPPVHIRKNTIRGKLLGQSETWAADNEPIKCVMPK